MIGQNALVTSVCNVARDVSFGIRIAVNNLTDYLLVCGNQLVVEEHGKEKY